jgi:predicted NBD/HSP70 family sugar kinase
MPASEQTVNVLTVPTTARYLGLGLASIVNAFDPDRICIGGEITVRGT